MVTRRPPLAVVVTDGRGRRLRAQALGRWLAGVAPAAARGELSVALVGDGKMRALNRRYRGRSRVTDVLSFPASAGPWPPAFAKASARSAEVRSGSRDRRRLVPGPRLLGDIVIATGVAARQARAQGHGFQTELRRLALHGLLHLLGYDHEQDAGRMARLERRLLRKGGVPVERGAST